MSKPLIAIVGRTNVGKSALFNRLVGARIAVVEDQPGVTRDRLYATAELDAHPVILVDTGGLIGGEEDVLVNMVAENARLALEEADLLLFVVDGQEGLTSHDQQVADMVRRSGKPYILVANKMEKASQDSSVFLDLHMGPALDISAIHNVGIGALLDEVVEQLPPPEPEEEIEDRIAIAVVGRPNVGKSSLINALLGADRVIVSDIPGTTREAIDIPLSVGDEDYLLVDTAGLRRRSRSKQAVEFYSTLRTAKAIERAEVVLVMVDASEGVTAQDQRIGGMAEEAGKATAIIANKWDVVQTRGAVAGENPAPEDQRRPARHERTLRRDFERQLRGLMPFFDYAEVLFTSAVRREGTDRILPLASALADNFTRRVATGPLNRVLMEAMEKHSPPSRKGRRLKIYYATQVAVGPPTIVCFVNDPKLMHWSYQRYLINYFRREFGFDGTPIRLHARPSHDTAEGGRSGRG